MDDPASYTPPFILDYFALAGPMTPGQTLARLFAIFILVSTNAFFVGAEFALVSVRRARIEGRAKNGSKRAAAALRLLDDTTLFISATQLGVTLASLGLGWIGEPTFAALLYPVATRLALPGNAAFVAVHGAATLIAFAVITFLHIVLGELVPKMLALEKAEALALVAARPLELFARIFRAPLWVLNGAGAAVARMTGLKSTFERAAVYTESELRHLIDVSRESGHLRAEERRLIHRVFEFSDTLVRETMVPRTAISAIPSHYSLEEIARAFRNYGYSRLPVYRESLDDMIGFIHSKDVMPYLLRPQSFRLEHVLQAPLYIVDTARLEDVLRQMQKARVHFGFVIDEHGGLEGIITLEDLLEEIVGEISDEHDEEVSDQIRQEGEDAYLLEGGLAVRDLNRRLHLSLPESEAYTTIAGFLMAMAGHVLQPGEVVHYNDLVFRIERVERRRIIRVRLELASDSRTAADGQPTAYTSTAAD
jgi:CBS domain containing-hemolysin-like protein